jgi:hypothetical protein
MTCLVQMDQSSTKVYWPVLVGSEAPVGVVKTVQLFAALVGPWCLLEPFAWLEFWRLLAVGASALVG